MTIMQKTAGLLVLLVLLAGAGCPSETGSEPGFTALFNGRDLSGWHNVNGAPSTWTVQDGMIVTTGAPISVLRTDRQYENFILELEWRHVHEGGNAGLFIHSDALPARGQPFTRSIECQILDGNHGDVFAIHGATMVPDRPHPRGWMRCLPSEERANPAGEWNHYRVESRDGRLTLAVNGKVVSGASEINPRKGYICLEAEGSEAHFRNIRIQELPSTNAPPEETAELDQGFQSLYNGVNLSGWRQAEGWRSDDWRLVRDSTGGHSEGTLWTEETYQDFVLMADWRIPCDDEAAAPARGGIHLRGSEDALAEIGCADLPGGEDGNRRPGGWNRYMITVQNGRLSVAVDGHALADEALPPAAPAGGPIGLALHGTYGEFANLFIKEL